MLTDEIVAIFILVYCRPFLGFFDCFEDVVVRTSEKQPEPKLSQVLECFAFGMEGLYAKIGRNINHAR